jgi:hypothetical protein
MDTPHSRKSYRFHGILGECSISSKKLVFATIDRVGTG